MVAKIRELCKNKGVSIAKVEKQAGLGNGTIGKWEKFSRKPRYESLKAIADVLGVPVSELTGDALPPEQKEKPPAQGGEPLDEELIKRLVRLTPEELEKVDAFVQGILAAR